MGASGTAASKESRTVFSLAGVLYTVRDVIDAAEFRGELQSAWREVSRRVACENRATEEELEADESAIDSAAQTFRYDHDLITAEETERWLEERGLTLNDFSDYFTRQYWGNTLGDQDVEEGLYHSASTEERELFIADADAFRRTFSMAKQLSWSAAAYVEAASELTLTMWRSSAAVSPSG
jgi:hypothetical protein